MAPPNRTILIYLMLLFGIVILLNIAYFMFSTSYSKVDVDNRYEQIRHDFNVLGNLQDVLANNSWKNLWWKDTSGNNSIGLNLQNMGTQATKHDDDDDNELKRVRVLCWIMTSPKSLMTKAIHIKKTWGSRCDHTLYMSSVENKTFPAVRLNVTEGRKYLFEKTKAAFAYIYYENLTKNFDWFLKADDDTYVIVENLKYFLTDKNASEPVYYGHNFKKYLKNGFMSGGAGYVLSRRAVEKFVTIALDNRNLCGRYRGAEDVAIGYCLQNVGVIAGDSRDALNRFRFLPLSIADFVSGHIAGWHSEYTKYEVQEGRKCCSDYLISCHYVQPDQMYVLEYFVYHLRRALPNSDSTNHVNKTQLPV